MLPQLQGVTVTPFRVLDEINQGMESINKCKVSV
jgi:chromosome segregation ATPase